MRHAALAAILIALPFSTATAGGFRPPLAAVVPVGFNDATFVTGLSLPVAMEFAPDGRLFVSEQGGRLRVIKNGALLSTPFLQLSVSTTGERGLLGVAFDPSFATSATEKWVYVYFTNPSGPHNQVSRFKVSSARCSKAPLTPPVC